MREQDLACWRAADAALERLLDLPPQQRARAAAELKLDHATRICLERLLAADSEPGDLPAPVELVFAADDLEGRRVGDWVLERRLGQGGMAVVYAAHAVADPERKVAIKLLTLVGLAGPGGERFRREQTILGRLNHPAIAALLDAGIEPDGTPWLAMSQVAGERIDRWCEERRADVRTRVRLIIDVCDAVAYAHRHLVVHRDLKPSNVLVDDEGRVHLLDFGIARLIADPDADATATHWRALSPRYAAPEQFRGASPSTAMDVFGLGALLYTVLVGEPPREEYAATTPILDPSRALAARAQTAPASIAAPVLRGDLDAIVMKALADDPQARYEGASVLAEDLRRWCAGQPVRARPASVRYRLGRFLRRHAGAVAASVLTAVLVLASGVAVLWQAREALAAQRETRSALARANTLSDFLIGLFRVEMPAGPRTELPSTIELLERGESEALRDRDADPRARADMLDALTEIRLSRDHTTDAIRLIEASLQLAEAIPDARAELRARALWRRSIAERMRNDDAAGLAALREAEQLLPDRFGSELALQVQCELAESLWQAERHLEAAALIERLLPLLQRHDVPGAGLELRIRSLAGAIYSDLGRHQESLLQYERVLEQRLARHGPSHFEVARALANAGNADRRLGHFASAAARLDQAIAIYDAVLDPRPSQYRASAHLGRGWLLVALGRYDEALAAFERGNSEFSAARGVASLEDYAFFHWNRGIALANAERWGEAIAALDRAKQLLARESLPLPQSLLIAEAWLARAHCARSDQGAGAIELEQARRKVTEGATTAADEISLVDEAAAACALAAGDVALARTHIDAALRRDAGASGGFVDQRIRRLLLASVIAGAASDETGAHKQLDRAEVELEAFELSPHPYRLRIAQLRSALDR
jgi:tetratricopeptide (TPR) repeat protein